MVRPTPKQDSAPRRPRNASTGAAVPPASAAGAPPESGATGLFRAVLSWDFGAVVARLAAGKGVIEGDLAHVPKTFTSAEHYVSTFEPLMLEEGAAQLVRGGDEDGGSGEATTHGAAVGGGAPGAPGGGALRDAGGGFGAVTLVLDGGAPAAAAFADNDAVLVTVGESKASVIALVQGRDIGGGGSSGPGGIGPGGGGGGGGRAAGGRGRNVAPAAPAPAAATMTAPAAADGASPATPASLRLRLALDPPSSTTTPPCCPVLLSPAARAAASAALTTPGARLTLTRLANLSTLAREWGAVQAVRADPPWAAWLLDPARAGLGKEEEEAATAVEEDGAEGGGGEGAAALTPEAAAATAAAAALATLPPGLRAALAADYNSSQIGAALAGLAQNRSKGGAAAAGGTTPPASPVVLVQGPPGTGKTRTILALLSILLHGGSGGGGGGGARPGGGMTPSASSSLPPPSTRPPASERARLWAASAPWWAGLPDPRDAAMALPATAPGTPPEGGGGAATKTTAHPPPVRIRSGGGGPPPRVLVCAPSNSALDEVVARLLSPGLVDGAGRRGPPALVRIGLSIHRSVAGVALDALVDARLRGRGSAGIAGAVAASSAGPASFAEGGGGGAEGPGGGGASAAASPAGPASTGPAARWERERLRAEVLDAAHVVCSTLSFAGSGALAAAAARRGRRFDALVVDEAAQAVEPATLVALARAAAGGATEDDAAADAPPRPPLRVFLVGDPAQLPATVVSARAWGAGYGTSLFARLAGAGVPVSALDTQYRMHPAISTFPRAAFYGGKLLDGPGVAEATARPWHAHPVFGPLAFFDVACGREASTASGGVGGAAASGAARSLTNKAEAELALALFKALATRYPASRAADGGVGLISPYKAQCSLLRSRLASALGPAASSRVEVSTVDGCQGRERDVVIVSAVRTGVGRSIGFVADERRANVALTRARASLLVIGHASALAAGDAAWAGLIEAARVGGGLFRPTRPFGAWVEAAAAGRVRPVPPQGGGPSALLGAGTPASARRARDAADLAARGPDARGAAAAAAGVEGEEFDDLSDDGPPGGLGEVPGPPPAAPPPAVRAAPGPPAPGGRAKRARK